MGWRFSARFIITGLALKGLKAGPGLKCKFTTFLLGYDVFRGSRVNFSLRDRHKNHPLLAGIGNVVALTSPLQPGLPILWASEIAPTCSLWFANSFILSWRIRLN